MLLRNELQITTMTDLCIYVWKENYEVSKVFSMRLCNYEPCTVKGMRRWLTGHNLLELEWNLQILQQCSRNIGLSTSCVSIGRGRYQKMSDSLLRFSNTHAIISLTSQNILDHRSRQTVASIYCSASYSLKLHIIVVAAEEWNLELRHVRT